ncbi:Uncharacterized protein OBRU01_11245, partial [Operophtera brumata]
EFVTNEATTTWKNFYEEQNKSVESSGNESGSRQPVGHLGKRVFDQQFEEQQLASLECTDDIKLTAPQNKFELSAFTNKDSKFFEDLALSCGEVTDRIDVNFSEVKQIGGDDLDEIQKDLNQHFGHGPIKRQNISEYIEVDLNMTHAMNNEDNMYITDTVHSPKVQDIFKNSSVNKDKDWVADKENIAINPYAIPRETDNFAINEQADKVLVFDGKRLTIQSENVDKESYRQTLVRDAPEEAPQRKTIVLNVNDDLPNFIDNPLMSNSDFIGIAELKKSTILDDISITEPLDVNNHRTILYDDDLGNISVTQAVPSNIVTEYKRQTKLYGDNTSNISVTQAMPSNIAEKLRTIIYDSDNSNISITQALPTNVQETKTNVQKNYKRLTICYDDGNMSITQALPPNILQEKTAKRRTIVYEDSAGNLSITQEVPNMHITETGKRRTIVYEDDAGNISVTQPIAANIIIAENSPNRRRAVVFESGTGNISVTQAVPSNVIQQQKNNDLNISETKMQILAEDSRRRTIVYENDTGNLSMTQAVPNQVIQGIATQHHKSNQVHGDDETTQAVSINQVICTLENKEKLEDIALIHENQLKHDVLTSSNATNRRGTVVFNDADADLSMTQAVPMNIIHNCNPSNKGNSSDPPVKTEVTNKRQTVFFENDEADISMEQAVNINQLIPGSMQQNAHDDLEAVLKETLHNYNKDGRRNQRTIVYDEENPNLSISQNLEVNDKNISVSQRHRDVIENELKQNTMVSEDITMEQTLPGNVAGTTDIKNTDYSQSKDPKDSILDVSMKDISVEENDESTTQARHQAEKVIRKSFKSEQPPANSAIKPIPSNFLTVKSESNTESVVKDLSKNTNIKSSTRSVSEVYVYQTALSRRNDQGNSKSKEPIVIHNDEQLSSTTKIYDNIEIKQNDKTSLASEIDEIYDDIEMNGNDENLSLSDIEMKQNDEKLSLSSEIDEIYDDIEMKGNDGNLSSFSDIDGNIEIQQNTDKLLCMKNDIQVKKSTESTNKNKQKSQIENRSKDTEQNQPELNICPSSSYSLRQKSKAILNDLLDMSDGLDEIGQTAQVDEPTKETGSVLPIMEEKLSINSNDSSDKVFVITKDSEDDNQITTDCKMSDASLRTCTISPLSLDYKGERKVVVDIQNKLEIRKDASSSKSRHCDKPVISDFNKEKYKVKELNSSIGIKSFKTANDTNELLEMLSDLTDKTMTRQTDSHLKEDEPKLKPILNKGHSYLESKCENGMEPRRRLSFATRSVVLSREELLNNISMAGASLKSRIEFDESDLNDTVNTSTHQDKSHKSVRLSSEVVKTLNFEETISETSILTDKNVSSLKKTVFGETSYTKERKAKVIPVFLKDVSDGVKELMDDLVKPNADALPYDAAGTGTSLGKTPSARSRSIQASLETSSQIDLTSALSSNCGSFHEVNVNQVSSISAIGDAVNKSVTRPLKSVIKCTSSSKNSSKIYASDTDNPPDILYKPLRQPPGREVIFDRYNPLNNILLIPETCAEVHRYNAHSSTDSINCSEQSVQISLHDKDKDTDSVSHSVQKPGNASSGNDKDSDSERGSMQCNVLHSVQKPGNASSGNDKDSDSERGSMQCNVLHSVQKPGNASSGNEEESIVLKPVLIDRSTDARPYKVKDSEVNTIMVMNVNKELVEDGSSLTLVDDAIAGSIFDEDIDSAMNISQGEMADFPVKFIYPADRNNMLGEQLDTDDTSNKDVLVRNKPKKRNYSPMRDKHKFCTMSSLDVTPKPISKMQKLSSSYVVISREDFTEKEPKIKLECVGKKSPHKSKKIKTGTSITVQQLLTEYSDPKYESSTEPSTRSPSQSDVQEYESLRMVSSFTSSKNLRDVGSAADKLPNTDWQTEPLQTDKLPNTDWQTEPLQTDKLPNTDWQTEPLQSDKLPNTDWQTEPLQTDKLPNTDWQTEPLQSDKLPNTDWQKEPLQSDKLPNTDWQTEPLQTDKLPNTDWQTEPLDDDKSKVLVMESVSSIDVVALIDMMPFMG